MGTPQIVRAIGSCRRTSQSQAATYQKFRGKFHGVLSPAITRRARGSIKATEGRDIVGNPLVIEPEDIDHRVQPGRFAMGPARRAHRTTREHLSA